MKWLAGVVIVTIFGILAAVQVAGGEVMLLVVAMIGCGAIGAGVVVGVAALMCLWDDEKKESQL